MIKLTVVYVKRLTLYDTCLNDMFHNSKCFNGKKTIY